MKNKIKELRAFPYWEDIFLSIIMSVAIMWGINMIVAEFTSDSSESQKYDADVIAVVEPNQFFRPHTTQSTIISMETTTTTTIPPVTTTTSTTIPSETPTAPSAATDGNRWDRLAECESGVSPANWAANTGNGYSGGLQFHPSTWRDYGGTGEAWQASRETQIVIAEKVLAEQGWKAWPACTLKLGYR